MKRYPTIRPLTLSVLLASGLAIAPLTGAAGESSERKMQSTMTSQEGGTAIRGEDAGETMSEDVREAWMEGKLETALLLNRHLNNFAIDPEVDGDRVVLTGTVASDVDRDLAEQIALSIDGIEQVENKLDVKDDYMEREAEDAVDGFANRVEDATLTAEVKLKLLANDNTEGMSINVDTESRVVTLEGDVASDARKELAGKIAANVDGVRDVHNKLRVKS